jgi:Tol biopolymer transport system component
VFVWRTQADTDLYVIQSNGAGLRRLTDLRGVVKAPAWSPDGTTIAFEGENLLRGRGRHFGIYRIRVDGTGLSQVTPSGATGFFEPAWQPRAPGLVRPAVLPSARRGGGLIHDPQPVSLWPSLAASAG